MRTERIASSVVAPIGHNSQNTWVSCMGPGQIVRIQADDLPQERKFAEAPDAAEIHLTSKQARHIAFLLMQGADISDGLVVSRGSNEYEVMIS